MSSFGRTGTRPCEIFTVLDNKVRRSTNRLVPILRLMVGWSVTTWNVS
jgi:hypothetical protein